MTRDSLCSFDTLGFVMIGKEKADRSDERFYTCPLCSVPTHLAQREKRSARLTSAKRGGLVLLRRLLALLEL